MEQQHVQGRPAGVPSGAPAVGKIEDRLYLLEVRGHLTRACIQRALEEIWADPAWSQPWGLVVHAHEGVSYDADIRSTPVPPRDRRAVGTAVVTPSSVQRMVISTIALALRVGSKFQLSAHEELDLGIEHMRAVIAHAESEQRKG